MKRFTHRAPIAAIAAAVLTLSGCGLGGTSDSGESDVEAGSIDPNALEGAELTVGSKDFDEQLLLGQMIILSLEAAGADVTDKTNIQGTTATRNALLSGEIDLYSGYTGTAWITFLGHDDPIQNAQEQFEAVKEEDLAKNGIVWGALAPFNNTYAMATTEKFAEANGLETLEDMADYVNSHPDTTICIESEFAARPDGISGMAKAYGMNITADMKKTLGTGVVYTQLAGGTCDFGEVFTTDGRITALELDPLEDTKSFFPLYNGAIQLRKETNEKYPNILEVLSPVWAELTTDTMAKLNSKVSSDGLPVDQVAKEFLKKEGFIK